MIGGGAPQASPFSPPSLAEREVPLFCSRRPPSIGWRKKSLVTANCTPSAPSVRRAARTSPTRHMGHAMAHVYGDRGSRETSMESRASMPRAGERDREWMCGFMMWRGWTRGAWRMAHALGFVWSTSLGAAWDTTRSSAQAFK